VIRDGLLDVAPGLVKRDFPAAKLIRKWYSDGTEVGN
jgi:hypothetical protein